MIIFFKPVCRAARLTDQLNMILIKEKISRPESRLETRRSEEFF